jgi:outer membrane protein
MRCRKLFLIQFVLALAATPLAAQNVQTLSRQEAENIAIQNHPLIQAAAELAVAASAQVREARSVYYPQAYGGATGVEAEHDSRIAAGTLSNSIIYDRYSNGVTVNQLVSDFGRTHELVKSSNLHAKAQQENVVTTRADVLLGVDQAFYGVLKAKAVLQVAQETVKDRQLVADQVGALTKSQLKSELDLSFANVDLAQAQLLLVQAQNDLQAANADLAASLGYGDERVFEPTEEPLPAAPPADVAQLIAQALRDRPELVGLRLDVGAATSYATAERDLWLPTLSAVGTAGVTPFREDELGSRYAAAGFNLHIPIFNGRLYGALRNEADARARAQGQYLRDLQDRIVRDVRTAWLNANSGFQRLSLTDQLLYEATQAFDLAQARYKLGLSSIVELSQAQLGLTQAEITQASAKYDYQTKLAVLDYQLGAIH